MSLKAQVKLTVRPFPDDEAVSDGVVAAWRFAFSVMQPWSVCDRPELGCDCPSPEVLLSDCQWHGSHAQKMCCLVRA
jgi:hypothetical protein